jgi:hypothetical protein
MTYTITDPRPTAKAHPTTFEVPTAEDIAKVGIGWWVKVIFETKIKPYSGERMWVKIMGVTDTHFSGFLDNEPVAQAGALEWGDKIEVPKEFVIGIMDPNGDFA